MKKLSLLCLLANQMLFAHIPDKPRHTPEHEAARAVMLQGVEAYNQHDYSTAMMLLQQASDAGDMKSSRYIGLMRLNGNGTPQNAEAAVAAFRLAASRGDITSQYWLGYCYENGIGVSKDVAAALGWYLISAQRGDHVSAPAMVAIAQLYAKGIGVRQDNAAAKSWLEKAAATGDDAAQKALDEFLTQVKQ